MKIRKTKVEIPDKCVKRDKAGKVSWRDTAICLGEELVFEKKSAESSRDWLEQRIEYTKKYDCDALARAGHEFAGMLENALEDYGFDVVKEKIPIDEIVRFYNKFDETVWPEAWQYLPKKDTPYDKIVIEDLIAFGHSVGRTGEACSNDVDRFDKVTESWEQRLEEK